MLLVWPAIGVDSLPLSFCLVLFPIPYYITHTALRYRHPIDPLITIFAVYALTRLWRLLAPCLPGQRLQTIVEVR